MSKAFKDTMALHTFDPLCQRRSKAPWLCTTLILHHVMSKARSNMAISCNSSFNALIACVFAFFSVLTIKWKLAFLPMCIFSIKKFSLDLEVTQENSLKTAGKTWLPAASRIFLANQRENKGQQSRLWGKQTFFIWLHYGGSGEIFIVFWTRKGKSLNFVHLFSMFRE